MGVIFNSRPTEMMAQINGLLVGDDGPLCGVLSTAKQVLAAGLVELAGDGSSATVSHTGDRFYRERGSSEVHPVDRFHNGLEVINQCSNPVVEITIPQPWVFKFTEITPSSLLVGHGEFELSAQSNLKNHFQIFCFVCGYCDQFDVWLLSNRTFRMFCFVAEPLLVAAAVLQCSLMQCSLLFCYVQSFAHILFSGAAELVEQSAVELLLLCIDGTIAAIGAKF
ncbi:hypothetical protein RHGRI_038842 [Rhododendron griersonianum]|uniref:Uncharacterized protein n=1 Tax=Rhododendron griersonianum TaxID=479676 RepID=A0AAV6HM57_9ERIC|nr:hypothetical protein RHGRI_038842 [Rhododendron griersonianum]